MVPGSRFDHARCLLYKSLKSFVFPLGSTYLKPVGVAFATPAVYGKYLSLKLFPLAVLYPINCADGSVSVLG